MVNDNEAIVKTKSGRLEGLALDGLYIFKGIPYAEPPVGPRRWMPPEPVKPWDGVRPAMEYGPISLQNMLVIAVDMPGVPNFAEQPQSEDCLTLNIWTPGLDDARRPVLLWIHGGAFIIGSGSEAALESGRLATRGDVVVVSINYRLGALGFMNLKEITGGRIPATGNEGLLDQVTAIDWVRDNIAGFGGDPENITIGGFSAGGMSVGSLLGMPAAAGKFHKAMNRSGAANIIMPLDSCVKMTEDYLEILGLKGKDADAIRGLTPEQILGAQQQLSDRVRLTEYRETPFQPVMDGDVFPAPPVEAVRKGSARNIPILAGNARDEMKAMNAMAPGYHRVNDEELVERLAKLLPMDLINRLVPAYREAQQRQGNDATPAGILGCINADIMFRMPTIQLVEAQRDNGAAAYNYLFKYRSPAMGGMLGAIHGLDSPFLFGELDAAFTGNSPEAVTLSRHIQDSCAAFMHTGNPSTKELEWPAYGQDRATMILDTPSRVEYAPFEDERLAWGDYQMVMTTPI